MSKLLLGLVVAGVVAVPVVVAQTSGDRAGGPDAAPTEARAAALTAAKMSTAQLAGQRIVTGYVGTAPPRSVVTAARRGRIGGVILFTNNMPTPAVARRAIGRLQAAAKAGKMPPLWIMIDQEGGIVQRLPQLHPTKSPAQIGRSAVPTATARAQGRATGRDLRRYGFNVNLAPSVDVVKVRDSFLMDRSYSRSAKVVADAGCAFAAGNEQHKVATSFKHFPGLGRAGADTDFNDVTINVTREQINSDTLAYRQCPAVPTMVMMSSARYPSLGLTRPASLEKKTYALLAQTGFDGLTITDALETPQYGSGTTTARSALKAGVDILLWGQAWKRAMQSRSRLLADLRSGKLTRAELLGGTEEIIAAKARIAP